MKKKLLTLVLCGLLIMLSGSLTGCSDSTDAGSPTPETTPAVSVPTAEVSKYKTNLTWADTKSYMFAVENEGYYGDIVSAGDYRFYPDLVSRFEKGEMVKGETPIVWDIYVSNNLYSNPSEMQESELVATIGGIDKDEANITLQPGQYVYVKYNNVVGEPVGVLQIDKIN